MMRDGSWKVLIIIGILALVGLVIKNETAQLIIIVLALAVAVLGSAWHRAEKELTKIHQKQREEWEEKQKASSRKEVTQ